MPKHQQHPQHESIQIHSALPNWILTTSIHFNRSSLGPSMPCSSNESSSNAARHRLRSSTLRMAPRLNGLTMVLHSQNVPYFFLHFTELSPGSSSHLLRHLMHFKVKCPMRSKRKPSTPYSSDGIRPGRSESWDRDRTDRIHITRIGSGIAFFICCTADKSANSCSKS